MFPFQDQCSPPSANQKELSFTDRQETLDKAGLARRIPFCSFTISLRPSSCFWLFVRRFLHNSSRTRMIPANLATRRNKAPPAVYSV